MSSQKTPHEYLETAVQEIALEGRQGCEWSRVWEMIGCDDLALRGVLEKMIRSSHKRIAVVPFERKEVLVATGWERVRAVGASQPYVVPDETELRILEIVGRNRNQGCSWVSTCAELKKNKEIDIPQQAKALPEAWQQTSAKKRKDKAQYGDQLALERLVTAGLLEKELVCSGQGTGNRITVNRLRLARYRCDELSIGIEDRITGGADAWKRALRYSLLRVLNQAALLDGQGCPEDQAYQSADASHILQAAYTILALPSDMCKALTFTDVWKQLKAENWLAKIESLMVLKPGPELSLHRAAPMIEICKRATNKDASIHFFLHKAIPYKPPGASHSKEKTATGKKLKPRDIWCIGIKHTPIQPDHIHLIPGRIDRRDSFSHRLPPFFVDPEGSTYIPSAIPSYHHSVMRTMIEIVRASGTSAGRARTLTLLLQQDTGKMVERCLSTLVRSGHIQLRRITEGRTHSFLAFDGQAFKVYNLCDNAVATAEQELVLKKSSNETHQTADGHKARFILDDPYFQDPFDLGQHISDDACRPGPRAALSTAAQDAPRPIPLQGVLVQEMEGGDRVMPSHKAPSHNGGSTPNGNEKKRRLDMARRRDSSSVSGQTIHKHATAERQRRAAHVIATLTKCKVVDKAVLQIALYRRSNSMKSKYRVDHKTWKRLIDQMIDAGQLNQMTSTLDQNETITLLTIPTATQKDVQQYLRDRLRRKEELVNAEDTKMQEKKRKAVPPPPPPPPPPEDTGPQIHPRKKMKSIKPSSIKEVAPPRAWRQHFMKISAPYRQSLTETLGIDMKKLVDLQEATRKKMAAGLPELVSKAVPPAPPPRKKVSARQQSSGTGAAAIAITAKPNNFNTRSVLKRLAPREKANSIVAGVPVLPVARSLAKLVVEAHLHQRPGLDAITLAGHATDSSGKKAPRATADAACSRLLRTGWAKHSSDLPDGAQSESRCLELPFDAAVDSARAELLATFGDPNFYKTLDEAVAAVDNLLDHASGSERRLTLPVNKIEAAHTAAIFQSLAIGTDLSLETHDTQHDGSSFILLRRSHHRKRNAVYQNTTNKKPHISEIGQSISMIRKWRMALGDTLNKVPWITSDGMVHRKLKGWLARLVFAAVLTCGSATSHAIAESRRRTTPSLDDLETAAILFDLCDAQCILIDREPPNSPPNKLTIFGPIQGNSQSTRSLALSALTNDRGSDLAPRFSPAPDALRKFLDFDLVTNTMAPLSASASMIM